MSGSGEFARWSAGLTMRHVPLAVRRATCRRILEAIAAGVRVARVGTVDPVVHVAVGIGGPQEAELIGHAAGRISAPAAALANGMLIGAVLPEHDVVSATMAAVLPAALAVGQEVKARGDEVLLAVVAGHEAACRVARGRYAPHAGATGAALAAARLMALGPSRGGEAAAIAGGVMRPGPVPDGGTPGLPSGIAAVNAILAARLAASGAAGPGSGATQARSPHDPIDVVEGLGALWVCAVPPGERLADHCFDLDACERLGGPRREARALVAEVRALAFAPSLDSILALTVKVAAGT